MYEIGQKIQIGKEVYIIRWIRKDGIHGLENIKTGQSRLEPVSKLIKDAQKISE